VKRHHNHKGATTLYDTILSRLGTNMSRKEKITTGFVILAILFVGLGMGFAYRNGYFGLGASHQEDHNSITNQATVQFCTEGDATSVCNPGSNLYSGTGTSNIVITTKEAATPAPDATPPSAPGTPTLTVINSTSISAAWSSSTDNVGVTGYNIDVSTASNFATFVTGLNNQDNGILTGRLITGLSPSTTYYVRVRARDAANNISASSATANAQTAAASTASQPCFRLKLQSKTNYAISNAIRVEILNSSTDAIITTITGASSLADGTVQLTLPQGVTLSDSATYHLRVKPTGYYGRRISGVTNFLTQCYIISDSQIFIPGDYNGDGRATISDIVAVIRAYNNTLDSTAQILYGSVKPGIGEVVRIIRLYNENTVDEN
jgi:hypothetical protein